MNCRVFEGIGGIYSTCSSYVLFPDLLLSQGYMFSW